MCTKGAIEHLNSNPRAISLSTLAYSFTLLVIGTTEWSANVKLYIPLPLPPLWATHTPLTVIDAKEVGNISVLAGCGGEFN